MRHRGGAEMLRQGEEGNRGLHRILPQGSQRPAGGRGAGRAGAGRPLRLRDLPRSGAEPEGWPPHRAEPRLQRRREAREEGVCEDWRIDGSQHAHEGGRGRGQDESRIRLRTICRCKRGAEGGHGAERRQDLRPRRGGGLRCAIGALPEPAAGGEAGTSEEAEEGQGGRHQGQAGCGEGGGRGRRGGCSGQGRRGRRGQAHERPPG
mmetsp:Transcript_81891/g.255741  ORF Transcript_81891/g.255741 Transcript_81891/m.255741 type:complete len:206 (-) Transcript_81891:1566-2183(-)